MAKRKLSKDVRPAAKQPRGGRGRCLGVTLALLVVAIAVAQQLVWPTVRQIVLMGGGFVALRSCSYWYLQGRSFQQLLGQELTTVAQLATVSYDAEASSVSAYILLPWLQRTAVYRPTLGCTLVDFEERMPIHAAPRLEEPDRDAGQDQEWPMGDRLDTAQVQAARASIANVAEIDRLVDQLVSPERGYNIRGLLVLYKGQIVAERYADGWDHRTPMMSWSAGKSWIATLLGMRSMQGKLDFEEPLLTEEFLGEEDGAWAAVTVEDGLRMRTGMQWLEQYDPFPPKDPTRMLFLEPDAAGYASRKPVNTSEHAARAFYYNSGTTNLLSAKLRRSFGADYEGYVRYPRAALFSKLGMRNSLMELDAAGTFVGSSLNYASVRDWARWALLHIRDGVWTSGERLLPEGWVDWITDGSRVSGHGSNGNGYGGQVWLRRPKCTPEQLAGPPPPPENPTEARAAWLLGVPGFRKCSKAELPADLFFANGFEGQSVFVMPREEIAVIRMGCTPLHAEAAAMEEIEMFIEALVQATRKP